VALQVPWLQACPLVQVVPQAPQLVGSRRRSTQTPLHRSWPAGHWHLPEPQNEPPVHRTPHPPQLSLLDWTSTQAPPQAVRPAEHAARHLPDTHAGVPAAQAALQAPQWPGLFEVSTQVPPQSVVPVGHPQAPSTHALPPVHALPQVLQLAGSELVSVQAPLHAVRPVAQVAAHMPTEQTWPPPQGLVHPPQWAGSVSTSTHVPPQSRCEGGHAHWPKLQA
jgi:hypothetical protein